MYEYMYVCMYVYFYVSRFVCMVWYLISYRLLLYVVVDDDDDDDGGGVASDGGGGRAPLREGAGHPDPSAGPAAFRRVRAAAVVRAGVEPGRAFPRQPGQAAARG